MTTTPGLLRRRDAQGSARVTQIELFFDLVFVFAVTQLSHTLLAHFTPLGAVQTLLLFASVWWAWIYTSWVTNWLDPDQGPVRVAMLALMLLGLVMSTSLPRAFGDRGAAYALAYVAMQLGRSLFMLWALRGRAQANYRNFQRIVAWVALAALLWLAGGVAPPRQRLWIWLAATGVELVSPAFGFWLPGLGRSQTRDWDVDGPHLADRCSAFVLIAVGEAITVTGAAFFELAWTPAVLAGFAAAVLLAMAMWWIYFAKAVEITSRRFAESDDPGRIARLAYTYVHSALVAGIILTAVADELVLRRPLALATPGVAATILGGPAVYLLGNGVFRRLLAPRFPPSHAVALAGLALLGAASPWLSRLELGIGAAATMIGAAALGDILYRRMTAGRAEA